MSCTLATPPHCEAGAHQHKPSAVTIMPRRAEDGEAGQMLVPCLAESLGCMCQHC